MRFVAALVVALGAALVLSSSAFAAKSTGVKGYTKNDGTYVAPHHKTAPNKTQRDNYGSKGNTNPYTGKEGTVESKK